MALTVLTFSNSLPSTCAILRDIQSVEFTTGAIGGYLTATIKLNRSPLGSYIELAFGYMLRILFEDGDLVWEGMISSLPQTVGEASSYTIGAVGFIAFLTYQTATWLPNYTIATDIRTIITDGLTAAVPQINFTSASAPLTGRLVTYSPSNNAAVRSNLDELIKYGNSANASLFWQVWGGRTFYLTNRPSPITTFDYSTTLALCEDSTIGLNGDDFYTRVSVRYRDYVSPSLIVTVNNTTMQTRYRQVFGTNDPAGTAYNFIREPNIVDVTGHGVITAAQATFIANTLLAKYSNDGIRMTASRLLISDGQAVRNATNSQIINLPKVRAGKSIFIPDIYGTGVTYPQNSYMFISQTKYTEAGDGTFKLEINAENIITLDNLLAGMLAFIPAEPV